MDFRKLQFRWKHGGYPEKVDYHGQVAQIKLAKRLGMKHVVVVSSMGGTNPTNFLNSVGKDKNGDGDGDILLWKRKAEMYLIEVRNHRNEVCIDILRRRDFFLQDLGDFHFSFFVFPRFYFLEI
jgi:hypothetical protein